MPAWSAGEGQVPEEGSPCVVFCRLSRGCHRGHAEGLWPPPRARVPTPGAGQHSHTATAPTSLPRRGRGVQP